MNPWPLESWWKFEIAATNFQTPSFAVSMTLNQIQKSIFKRSQDLSLALCVFYPLRQPIHSREVNTT